MHIRTLPTGTDEIIDPHFYLHSISLILFNTTASSIKYMPCLKNVVKKATNLLFILISQIKFFGNKRYCNIEKLLERK